MKWFIRGRVYSGEVWVEVTLVVSAPNISAAIERAKRCFANDLTINSVSESLDD